MTDQPDAMPKDRIAKALDLAAEFGTIDGGHHKQWVIDQMVRALTGCPMVDKVMDFHGRSLTYKTQGESPEYQAWVHDGGEYVWDEGIAP